MSLAAPFPFAGFHFFSAVSAMSSRIYLVMCLFLRKLLWVFVRYDQFSRNAVAGNLSHQTPFAASTSGATSNHEGPFHSLTRLQSPIFWEPEAVKSGRESSMPQSANYKKKHNLLFPLQRVCHMLHSAGIFTRFVFTITQASVNISAPWSIWIIAKQWIM